MDENDICTRISTNINKISTQSQDKQMISKSDRRRAIQHFIVVWLHKSLFPLVMTTSISFLP